MKRINFILVSVIITLILSCSKNDTTDDLPDETVKFYSSSPNKNFAPIAKKYDLSSNTEIWLFGSFDNTGLHDTIKRIVVDKKALNYYSSILIDKLNRPFMIYTTNKNGTNENVLLKIDYPINQNKIVYSKYYYDWSTKTDSLLRQQVVDTIIGSSIFTYRTQVETNSNYWNKTYIQLNEIDNNIFKFIDNNIDPELFPKSNFTLRPAQGIAAGIAAIQVHQMLQEAKLYANAAEVLNEPISINEYIAAENQSFSNFINSSSNVVIPNPTGTPSNPNGSTTVTDIDGNIYNTIQIGTQTWMVENLRTTKFNDGSTIPIKSDFTSWQSISTATYCYSNFSSANLTNNGLIYNIAAASAINIAPTGWHVATANDWFTLCEELGGNQGSYLDYYFYNNVANQLGALDSAPPYTTNASGFNAKKVSRLLNSSWENASFGNYWTSTTYGNKLRHVDMSSDSNGNAVFIRASYNSSVSPGMPIRCIKD